MIGSGFRKLRGWRWAVGLGAALLILAAGFGLAQGARRRAERTPTPPATTTLPPTLVAATTFTAEPPASSTPTAGRPATSVPSATLTHVATTATSTRTPTPRFITHTIQAGDTISALSVKYDVAMSEIVQASGIKLDTLLRIGQVITIPLPAIPNTPTLAPTATSSPLPADAELITQGVIAPTREPDFLTYEVRAGDTLESISEQFNVKITYIVAANDIKDPRFLRIGQKLRIPLRPPTPTPLPMPRPLPSSTAGPRYPTPRLLSPVEGEILRGAQDGLPLLIWSAVGLLDEDEFYLARLWSGKPPAGEFLAEEWTKGTSWRAPADLAPAGANAPQAYYWSVIVARREGRPGDYVWTPLSAQSAMGTFVWRP